MRNFAGSGRLDWPEFRLGGDLDLISTPSARLGVDIDFSLKHPFFEASSPALGVVAFQASRVETVGGHLAYNSPDCGTIGWSLEARARRYIKKRGTNLKEVELALGLRPRKRFGTVSFRGGFRYTSVSLEPGLFRFPHNGMPSSAKWSISTDRQIEIYPI